MSEINDPKDVYIQRRTKGRYLELAAMLKEKKHGNKQEYDRIVAKFCLQEGLTLAKAIKYAEAIEIGGLIKWTEHHGKKKLRWKYNEKQEWDFFKISL
jgi:hypothetical protein